MLASLRSIVSRSPELRTHFLLHCLQLIHVDSSLIWIIGLYCVLLQQWLISRQEYCCHGYWDKQTPSSLGRLLCALIVHCAV